MPYPIATARPPEKKEELDSGDYRLTLERCLKEFGWQAKNKLKGKLIEGCYHGLGVGCYIEGGATGPRESARIVLDPDGKVSVFVGSTSVGQGLETVMVQIAADALGLPMERIRIFHGSTTGVTEGFGSYHSRATVMGGSAVLLAAREIKEKVAARLGRPSQEIDLEKADLRALAADGISAEATYANTRHTYSYGAAAAHVTVDPKTGQVRLLDYVVVQDMGRVINPLTAHGQLLGALVQGLGGAFLEHLQYDRDGQFLSASLADYLLPSATDFPSLRGVVMAHAPTDIGLMGGAKGASEGGLISVGGVIGNAVAAALAPLGVEPRRLPLTPPAVWEAIQSARRSEGTASDTSLRT
jgi:carbon-monoxide dehydrogenase large subunit